MDERSFKEAIQDAKSGEELMEAFVGRVGEDKEQARALLQRYKETVKGLPTVAKAAIQLGYGKVIAEIDQRFADAREIGQQGLANEMGVARDANARQADSRQWQQAHEDRSDVVTGAVSGVKNVTTNTRSVVALGAIKLSTLGAKTARLFGAKDAAKTIQERGSTYAHALMTKDSRVDDLAQNMAESGFMKYDQVIDTIEQAAQTCEAYARAGVSWAQEKAKALRTKAITVAKNVKDTAVKGAEFVAGAAILGAEVARDAAVNAYKTGKTVVEQGVKTVKEAVENTRTDMGNIGKDGVANEIGVAGDVSARNAQARQWQQAHEDRSDVVTGAVGAVQKTATDMKARVAVGAIKLSTLGAKAARLFGAKNAAKDIQERGSTYAHALLTKDSRVEELAQNMAESGFMKYDQVVDTIEQAAQTCEAYARAGVSWAQEKAQKLKQAAITAKTKSVEFAKRTGEKIVEGVKDAGAATYIFLDDAGKAVKRKAEDVIINTAAAVETGVHAVKDGVDTVITGAYVAYDDGRKAVVQGAKNVKAAVETKIQETRENLGEVDAKGQVDQMYTARQAAARKADARDWQQAHENRSEAVTGTVDFVDSASTSVRSVVSNGIINLATVGAKGAALFGAKGLAKKMQDRAGKTADRVMTRESKVGKFFRDFAERGFMTADKVRTDVETAKDTTVAYAKAGVDMVKDAGEVAWDRTKQGALAVGKAVAEPAAMVVALGSLAIDSGIEAGKKVGEKIETVSDIASAKVETVKDGMRVGFNARAQKFMEGIAGKLTEAATRFKSNKEKAAQDQEQSQMRLAAAKSKNSQQKEAQENDGFDK